MPQWERGEYIEYWHVEDMKAAIAAQEAEQNSKDAIAHAKVRGKK